MYSFSGWEKNEINILDRNSTISIAIHDSPLWHWGFTWYECHTNTTCMILSLYFDDSRWELCCDGHCDNHKMCIHFQAERKMKSIFWIEIQQYQSRFITHLLTLRGITWCECHTYQRYLHDKFILLWWFKMWIMLWRALR